MGTTGGMRVLVTDASQGRTAGEVAARIASRLRDAGLAAEVRPIGAAGDPAGAGAVVLGSAVYDQRRLPETERFAGEHADAPASRPL
ncbi:flavodoxin domain-containing protein [Miltoncostaea marina]|uniref:flavodoxin domain-containing protein n=1 Tax=Miltoncostaea marina TaxID=2843215 RepID=UPI001C3D0291|nr:flavodoxin domain-containing protein [Miltoncostaea marina]